MARTINVEISGQFVRKDNKNAGVMGEGNVTTVSITFDETWRGFGKRIVWRDANGENPVSVILFDGNAEEAAEEPTPMVYTTTIPREPLEIPGWCSFSIEGYKEEDGVHKVSLSVSDTLMVAQSDSYHKPAEPTPSQTQQILEELGKTEAAVKASASEAKSWAIGGTGTRPGEDTDNAKYYAEQARASKTAAEASAGAAAASAQTASESEAGAEKHSNTAATWAIAAQTARNEANEARDQAKVSATEAASSASAAKDSETAASGSASGAASSASSASDSASSASISANEAKTADQAAKQSYLAARDASQMAMQSEGRAAVFANNAAQESAKAASSASAAKTSETNAREHMEDAQTAQRAIENMTVSVKTLAPGNSATATKTTVGDVVNIEYGIPRGEKGDGFKILGYYDNLPALESAVPSPAVGDPYGVGTAAPYDIYIWDGTVWKNNGPIQGPAGQNGEDGADGKAATVRIGTVTTGAPGSNAAVNNSGTESDAVFDFTIPQGPKGDPGADGKSPEPFNFGTQTPDEVFFISQDQFLAMLSDSPPAVIVKINDDTITMLRCKIGKGAVYYSSVMYYKGKKHFVTLDASGVTAFITIAEESQIPTPNGAADKEKILFSNDSGGFKLVSLTEAGIPTIDYVNTLISGAMEASY